MITSSGQSFRSGNFKAWGEKGKDGIKTIDLISALASQLQRASCKKKVGYIKNDGFNAQVWQDTLGQGAKAASWFGQKEDPIKEDGVELHHQ